MTVELELSRDHGCFGAGGVGRFRTSLGCRGTRRPFGSRTNTVSTVSPLGSWNDDGFTGSGNDHPLFPSHEIDDTIPCNKRAA